MQTITANTSTSITQSRTLRYVNPTVVCDVVEVQRFVDWCTMSVGLRKKKKKYYLFLKKAVQFLKQI